MPDLPPHLPGDPIPLLPPPHAIGACPGCSGALTVQAMHLAGWRSLVRGRCDRCDRSLLQDLPCGHGLLYPATLDLDTGETIAAPGAGWFSDPLREYWEHPDAEPVAVHVERRRSVERVTVLNCLDVVYGHSLLKLLNAARDPDAAVVVPRSLSALVPETVAEVWVVDASFGRLRSWLIELEARLGEELGRFESATVSPAFPHPHPSTYRIADFTAGVEPESGGRPSVVLSLRDDRLWGGSARSQRRNVAALRRVLSRAFPRVGIAAVGVGGATRLPGGVVDCRRAHPADDDERSWLARAAGADLVIGVHGSNMLLPSGLARSAIELVPRDRYGNVLQATLLDEPDPLTALWRHRSVYGDRRLRDVSGERVGELAADLLAEDERFRAVMLGPLAGRGGPVPRPIGASEPVAAHPVLRLARGVRSATSLTGRLLAVARYRGAARAATLRARRGTDPPRVMQDRRGLRFELVSRQEIAQFVRSHGHFEGREIDFLVAFAEPGNVVVDVGANIGAFSAPLARAVGPDGAVHAFEPLPVSRARLERTVALNGLGNVVVNPLAVGAATATVELVSYGPGFESWASTVPRHIEMGRRTVAPVERTTVQATTLDDYCAERGLTHVDVLKIDVEGGEPAVLEGADGLLARNAIDLVMFELSENTLPAGVQSYEVLDRISAHGYRTFVLTDAGPRPFRSAGRLEFANVVAVAPSALPRLARVQSRTKR